MRLLLINPDNPVVGSTKVARGNRLNRFRIWKPLGLLTLARLTPREWEIEVVDENNGPYDYEAAPRPDLVGITAFTSGGSDYLYVTNLKSSNVSIIEAASLSVVATYP